MTCLLTSSRPLAVETIPARSPVIRRQRRGQQMVTISVTAGRPFEKGAEVSRGKVMAGGARDAIRHRLRWQARRRPAGEHQLRGRTQRQHGRRRECSLPDHAFGRHARRRWRRMVSAGDMEVRKSAGKFREAHGQPDARRPAARRCTPLHPQAIPRRGCRHWSRRSFEAEVASSGRSDRYWRGRSTTRRAS